MKKIDTNRLVNTGLRAAGFNIDQDNTEMMLQISDYVRANPDATLKDILRVKAEAEKLVKESKEQKQ